MQNGSDKEIIKNYGNKTIFLELSISNCLDINIPGIIRKRKEEKLENIFVSAKIKLLIEIFSKSTNLSFSNLETLHFLKKNDNNIPILNNDQKLEKILTAVKRNAPNQYYLNQEKLTKKIFLLKQTKKRSPNTNNMKKINFEQICISNLQLSGQKVQSNKNVVNSRIYFDDSITKKKENHNNETYFNEKPASCSSLYKSVGIKCDFSKVSLGITFHDASYYFGQKLLRNQNFLILLNNHLRYPPFKQLSASINFSFLNVINKYSQIKPINNEVMSLIIRATFSLCTKFYNSDTRNDLFISKSYEQGGLLEIVNAESSIIQSCFHEILSLNPKNILELALNNLIENDNINIEDKNLILSKSLSLLFKCLIYPKIAFRYDQNIIVHSCLQYIIWKQVQSGKNLNNFHNGMENLGKQKNIDFIINKCIIDILLGLNED